MTVCMQSVLLKSELICDRIIKRCDILSLYLTYPVYHERGFNFAKAQDEVVDLFRKGS